MFFRSVGITAFSAEKKERLRVEARKHLPDPAGYQGHPYTTSFRLDEEPILLEKRRDGTVELSLTTDGPDRFPL